jgi:hypothetical protein
MKREKALELSGRAKQAKRDSPGIVGRVRKGDATHSSESPACKGAEPGTSGNKYEKQTETNAQGEIGARGGGHTPLGAGTGRAAAESDAKTYSESRLHTSKNARTTKYGRYSGDITLMEISEYFDLPAQEAARRMGVGLTVLKRLCRKFGVERWPYRRPARKMKKSDSSAVDATNDQVAEDPGEDEDTKDNEPDADESTLHIERLFQEVSSLHSTMIDINGNLLRCIEAVTVCGSGAITMPAGMFNGPVRSGRMPAAGHSQLRGPDLLTRPEHPMRQFITRPETENLLYTLQSLAGHVAPPSSAGGMSGGVAVPGGAMAGAVDASRGSNRDASNIQDILRLIGDFSALTDKIRLSQTE